MTPVAPMGWGKKNKEKTKKLSLVDLEYNLILPSQDILILIVVIVNDKIILSVFEPQDEEVE